jgi:hypothetical protein
VVQPAIAGADKTEERGERKESRRQWEKATQPEDLDAQQLPIAEQDQDVKSDHGSDSKFQDQPVPSPPRARMLKEIVRVPCTHPEAMKHLMATRPDELAAVLSVLSDEFHAFELLGPVGMPSFISCCQSKRDVEFLMLLYSGEEEPYRDAQVVSGAGIDVTAQDCVLRDAALNCILLLNGGVH